MHLAMFVGNESRLQMWTNTIPTNLHQGETANQTAVKKVLPPAVNWHFWPWCNYGCKFCFARFEDIPLADRLPREIALLVPAMLKQAGAEKITFVGGEPTLCPFLDELLIESKNVGLTTCIVSNASGLTEEFLTANANYIDWIGLSIDASNDSLHAKIGRGKRSDLKRESSHHLAEAREAWIRCKQHGIRMKLNTVVCRHNVNDDMSELVSELRPERWKIFQVLPVEGQNDDDIDDLLISSNEFQTWVERHSHIEEIGIQFVPESNDLMRGSYAMMDAIGRFYSNADGGHRYGPSVIEVGVQQAWEDICFFEERFLKRGGIYEWNQPNQAQTEAYE